MESQPGPDPTLEGSEGPQPSSKEISDITGAARQILTKNPDIAQWMMEHLRTHPGKVFLSEEFQTTAKPIEDQPRMEGVQEGTALQVPASKEAQIDPVGTEPGPRFMSFEQLQASPSTNPSPQRLGKSPLGRFKLAPRKGVVFSLEAVLETSPVQVRGEGTSSEPVQAGLGSPAEARVELVSRAG